MQARKRLSLLTALVTLLTVVVIPTGAFAADIGPIDCVSPTLQSAINGATGGDTIIITDGSTCTGNFTVNKALTIRAESAAGATLDGNDVDGAPVVTVTGGGLVTLQDLTITGGLNSAGDGGGITSSATLNLVRTTVTANSALNGGGIWNDGTLTVTDSVVSANTATQGGGGIHNISGGTVNGTNTTVSGNTAEHAGGILNNGAGDTVDSSITLTNSFVTGNSATGSDGDPAGGGGIYNFNFPEDTVKAQLTLVGTEVSTNTSAESGAGIRNGDGVVTITGGEVTGNIATGNGGGIRTSGTMTITGADISGNSATTAGGGISLDGDSSTLTVAGSTINANTATTEGGGIASGLTTTVGVIESSVTRNSANSGGGLSNAGTANVSNSTFSANTVTTQGGGLLSSGNLTVTVSTITGNDATSEGGGIRVIGTPTVTVSRTILFGNTGGSGFECSGPITSGGFNLVGSTAAPCAYAPNANDLPALSDPMLDVLGFYGEATEHHPLQTGSDAIDAAGACAATVDQKGDPRPDGPACDVGAIEATSPVMADEVLLVEPNGRWHIKRDGMADYTFFYGVPGDIPIFGDWNGDGIDTPGAYRVGPGGGFAYMTNTLPPNGGAGVADFNFYFGDPSLGDEVLVGDWDGDGIDTIGVNRNGRIFLTDTNASGGAPAPTDYDFFFGVPGDKAFGGDPDGDGSDGLFLYRGSGPGAGFVYYRSSLTTGVADDNFFFGIASDLFVSGDWDRDGVDTAGIFRASDTTVYLTNTNASGGAPAPTDDSYVFGQAGWTPVAGVSGVN